MSSSDTTANIPTSTSVLESVVIKAPLSHVWHFIKLHNFSAFWSALSKSEVVTGASNETDVFKWTFKDGTVYEVKQEEHSVRSPLPMPVCTFRTPSILTNIQSINHMITYSVITSSPELTYSSVLSTIRCHAVTAGAHANSTYVEWDARFSSDANAGELPFPLLTLLETG